MNEDRLTEARRLVTVAEGAERHAVARRKVRYLIERGELAVVRAGYCVRFYEDDLERLLAAAKTPKRPLEVPAEPRTWLGYARLGPAGARP